MRQRKRGAGHSGMPVCFRAAILPVVLTSLQIHPADGQSSPPHRATQEKVIASLKAHRGGWNKVDARGLTPLMSAAQDGSFLVVKYLLDHGARIALRAKNDLPADQQNTALGYAVLSGHLVIAEELLRRGAKINGEKSGITLTSDMSLPVPLLTGAVRGNDKALVKWLAKHGANMDALNEWKHPALFYAEDAAMVKTLLACGAHVNPRRSDIPSVLDDAITTPSPDIGPNFSVPPEVTYTLLEVGANDAEAMGLAVSVGGTELLQKMLRKGWSPNRRNKQGLTSLMVAASEWRPNIIRLLLQSGASINLRTARGETALSIARSSSGNREYEPRRPVITPPGYAPSTEANRQEVIRLLKAAGATG